MLGVSYTENDGTNDALTDAADALRSFYRRVGKQKELSHVSFSAAEELLTCKRRMNSWSH
jgi:hypothetical protein